MATAAARPPGRVLPTVLGAQAFARGLAVDNCGCFGVYLGQPLRWWVPLQDGLLLLYSGLLVRAARTARSPVAVPA